MNIEQFNSAQFDGGEHVSVVLERREVEAAISALLALDLARAVDHPVITSTLASLRSQLDGAASKAA